MHRVRDPETGGEGETTDDGGGDGSSCDQLIQCVGELVCILGGRAGIYRRRRSNGCRRRRRCDGRRRCRGCPEDDELNGRLGRQTAIRQRHEHIVYRRSADQRLRQYHRA